MDYANFMAYLAISIILIVAITAIVIAHRAAQREEERRVLAQRSKRLLDRANDILETTTTICDYINNGDIIDALIQYYLTYIHQREQLAPQIDTEKLISRGELLRSQFTPSDSIIELNSDAEIKRCKIAFKKASKILRVCASKNIVSKESFMSMQEYLKFTLLQLEVTTFEKMGDLAGEKKNPAVATNYYKYAKKLLIESDLNFEGKHEHIRNITEKNQTLFGNVIKEKLDKNLADEKAVDEFGLPADLNVMAGKARKD